MIAERTEDKKLDQASRILRLIRRNNKRGVPNFVLASISLKYSSRIAELRKDGYPIYAERQRINGRLTGQWNYFINEDEE